MTSAQLRELATNAAPAVRDAINAQLDAKADTKTPRKLPSGMNKLERDFSEYLEFQKRAGHIVWWSFNSVRLCIAGGERKAWFRPDFFVQRCTGETVIYETKGFMREAANVRLKVAVTLFPWRIFLVRRIKGEWQFTEYKK